MAVEPAARGFIELGELRIAYERYGNDEPIVFIHGIPTSAFLWRNVMPPLLRQGHSVLAFDLLGYGQSSKPMNVDLGIAAQAKLLEAALRQMNWSGGTIVGHDIGGGIAQLICLGDDLAVKRLVLVDTIAYDSFPVPAIARLKDDIWDAIVSAPDFDLRRGFAKAFEQGVVDKQHLSDATINAYAQPFEGVSGRLAYLRAARALRTEELASKASEIERLEIPTLIAWGAGDAFQPISLGMRLAAAMPRARLRVFARAGHFLPEEEPAALAHAIHEFVVPECEGEA